MISSDDEVEPGSNDAAVNIRWRYKDDGDMVTMAMMWWVTVHGVRVVMAIW